MRISKHTPSLIQRARSLRVGEALRGVRGIIRDPDDGVQVVRIVDACSGWNHDYLYDRFMQTHGASVLARELSLLDVLLDREALSKLPEGSLGRAYYDFQTLEELTPDGLAQVADDGRRVDTRSQSGDRARFEDRMFDSHDLMHVVTGYGRDLIGEASLLAFTYVQSGNPGAALLVGMLYLLTLPAELPKVLIPRCYLPEPPPGLEDRAGTRRFRAKIREGYRRGQEASWIMGADWESLLERPLVEVRRTYGITEPVPYGQVRSAGSPKLENLPRNRFAGSPISSATKAPR